jgi:hypothetical protein
LGVPGLLLAAGAAAKLEPNGGEVETNAGAIGGAAAAQLWNIFPKLKAPAVAELDTKGLPRHEPVANLMLNGLKLEAKGSTTLAAVTAGSPKVAEPNEGKTFWNAD